MKKIGKKGLDWLEAKPKLIKEYEEKGITICENCGGTFILSIHHRPKRSTGEAVHDFKHTRLLDQKCHGWFEYHEEDDKKLFKKKRGYHPEDEIKIGKKKKEKASWETGQKCSCGAITYTLICPQCGKLNN